LENPTGSLAAAARESESVVRKQIAEAQRGGKKLQLELELLVCTDIFFWVTEGSHQVVAVGKTSTLPAPMTQYPTSAAATTSAATSISTQVALDRRNHGVLYTGSARKPQSAAMIRTCHPAPSSHVLNLPILNPVAALSIPQLKPSPVNPGYQEAHQYYDEMRRYYASKAYTSAATAELVVVKVRMVTLQPGKKKTTFVSVSEFFCTIS
jgi:hypothetical protein